MNAVVKAIIGTKSAWFRRNAIIYLPRQRIGFHWIVSNLPIGVSLNKNR
jgi:hypothetical protein